MPQDFTSACSETAAPRPAYQGLKWLIVSKADGSADRTVLSTVTPSCFLFRTANLNSRSQQTSNNLTSAFKQQKAGQKRTWTYSSFFTKKLSNHIYKRNILKVTPLHFHVFIQKFEKILLGNHCYIWKYLNLKNILAVFNLLAVQDFVDGDRNISDFSELSEFFSFKQEKKRGRLKPTRSD